MAGNGTDMMDYLFFYWDENVGIDEAYFPYNFKDYWSEFANKNGKNCQKVAKNVISSIFF
jgi:hypothetical protein